MSCDIGDAVSELRDIAIRCNDFNYVEGKSRKGIREHTREEYVEFLEQLARSCYSQYENTAEYLGWI